VHFIPKSWKGFDAAYILDICGYAVHRKNLDQFSALFASEQILLLGTKKAVGDLANCSKSSLITKTVMWH